MLHFVGHRNSENLTKLNVGILSDGRNGGAAAGGRNRTAVFCDAQADPCSQGPTKPAHSPPDSHTAKKKKKTLFQKYIYCKNSVLSLSKNLKCEFTNTENYSTNSNATQDMWILQQVWDSQHTCVGDGHVSAPTCTKILSRWFQDVRENQSASTRQLLPHFP